MLDPVKILKRSWHILWSYRALWVFGLVLALAAGSASSHGSNNSNYRQDQRQHQQLTPHDVQQGFKEFKQELNKIFEQGIPEAHITGQALTTFLWVIGAFVLIMTLVGIVMAIARYVSETAVIRMVDDYETSGNKMTVRQGFRIGWSRTAWRLFLINLIVNLPAIALVLVLLFAGIGVYFAWVNGTANFAAFSTVATIVLAFITIFVVVILSIGLHLLRNFFWRVSVLEDTGVRESFGRGFAFVLEKLEECWFDVACDDRSGNRLGSCLCYSDRRQYSGCDRDSGHCATGSCPPAPAIRWHLQHFPRRLPPVDRRCVICSASILYPCFLTMDLLGSWQSVYTSTVGR
jgi:hypothetical protein